MTSNSQLQENPATTIDELTGEIMFSELSQPLVSSTQAPSAALSNTAPEDRTLSVSDPLTGLPGETITVPINISDATGLQSLEVTLTYDTNLLDIPDPDSATDINEGVKRVGVAANWRIITGEGENPNQEQPNPIANVNEETGEVKISLINPGEVPIEGSGEIITIDFQVAPNAEPNFTANIDLKTASLGVNDQETVLGESNLTDGDITGITKGPIVYRFLEQDLGLHLYSSDAKEIAFIQENLNNYISEGEAYQAVDPLDSNAATVYRFLNTTTNTYLYTLDVKEKDFILENLNNFRFEGEKFSAYQEGNEFTTPVYRFLESSGSHFQTSSEKEKTFIEQNLPNYTFEGIAYHAFAIETSQD